jgi:hypothetical protein
MVFLEDEQSNFIFNSTLIVESISSNYFNENLPKLKMREIKFFDMHCSFKVT